MKRSRAKRVQYAISGEQIPGRQAMDWKGLATLATALLAVLGFFWNKAEGCAEKLRADAVQAASYDALAKGITELTTRVSALEQAVVSLPSLFTKRQGDAEKLVAPVKQPAPLTKMPLGAADYATATGAVVLRPPDELFQKISGLPTFDAVKQAAEPKN